MGDSTLAQVATSMIPTGDKAPTHTHTGKSSAENSSGGAETSPNGDETCAVVGRWANCRRQRAKEKPEANDFYLRRRKWREGKTGSVARAGSGRRVPTGALLPLLQDLLKHAAAVVQLGSGSGPSASGARPHPEARRTCEIHGPMYPVSIFAYHLGLCLQPDSPRAPPVGNP
jgi:hypothetical protein